MATKKAANKKATAKKATKTSKKKPAKKASKKATKKTAKKATKTSQKKPAKKAVKKAVKKRTTKATKKAAKKAEERPFTPGTHALVPKHEVLDEKGILAFFDKYDLQPTSLPTIYIDDAALRGLDVKIGDIIKISRKSHTAGNTVFYRRVAYE